jgi:hypothetical protein
LKETLFHSIIEEMWSDEDVFQWEKQLNNTIVRNSFGLSSLRYRRVVIDWSIWRNYTAMAMAATSRILAKGNYAWRSLG